MRLTFPPHLEQVPLVALRPFFKVTTLGFLTSCCALHLKQYAFILHLRENQAALNCACSAILAYLLQEKQKCQTARLDFAWPVLGIL